MKFSCTFKSYVIFGPKHEMSGIIFYIYGWHLITLAEDNIDLSSQSCGSVTFG